MGVNGNIHTNYTPEDRAEAERIAALRQSAFASVVSAASSFDTAGQRYWEASLPAAIDACREAFDQLRRGRDQFLEVGPADLEMRLRHRDSPKVQKALEIGLGRFAYDPEGFTARALIYDRRAIQLIDHLLAGEAEAIASLEDGRIEGLYNAVSVSCRELFDVVGDHMRRMIADAKVSHEVADIVGMVWTPNLGETPQETVPTTERETELVTS